MERLDRDRIRELRARTSPSWFPPVRAELRLSSDAAFHGNADLPNPEQLLVASASSCQLLMFLAIAARSRIEVLAYQDDAEAVMPEDTKPMRITQITLRPRILVAPQTNHDRVRSLVDRAHDGCYIANTINAEIVVEPTIEHATEDAVRQPGCAGQTP